MDTKRRVVFFANSSGKYIQELHFLIQKLDIRNYCIYGIGKRPEQDDICYKQVTSFDQIEPLGSEDIVVGYGKGFGGVPLTHMPYFLPKAQTFMIDDGIAIDLSNLTVRLERKSLRTLIPLFLKFYGFWRFVQIVLKTLCGIKLPSCYQKIPAGLLEYVYTKEKKLPALQQKIKNQKSDSILIIEQPFLHYLPNAQQKAFFDFLQSFCEKNKKYTIVFKLHPRSDIDWYASHLQADNLTYVKEGEILEYMSESKYLLGFFSTALFIGLALGKKVIVIDPIGLYKKKEKIELLQYKDVAYMNEASSVEECQFSVDAMEISIEEAAFNFSLFQRIIR